MSNVVAIKDLITIVSPRKFARWVSQEKKNPGKPAPAAGKGGRPRKPDEVRALILKLASEGAGCGASRIHGILTNLKRPNAANRRGDLDRRRGCY